MNERIKELTKAAGLNIDGYGYPIWGCLHGEDEKKAFLEKFAELIVQECIDIISPYTVRMSRPGEEYLHPILEIKKHFGVEE